MNIRTICLALLAHGEASGYDLKTRWTEGPFSHFVDASFSSIYPALARLEEEGLVSFREESQSGKPSRKVYSLTNAGREAFVSAMSVPPEPDIFRSSFAMIALCAPFLDRETISRAIDVRLKDQRMELNQILEARGHCDYPALNWLLDWGLSHFSADLAHIEANRAQLEAIAGGGTPGMSAPVCPMNAVAAPRK